MPIIDARAINYNQMKEFISTGNLNISFVPGGGEPQKYSNIAIISITDPNVPAIFNFEDLNIITFQYRDIEVRDGRNLNFFEPDENSEYMTSAHANKILDFVETHNNLQDKQTLLLVNCMAGMCRSGAIVDFVSNIYGFGCWDTKKRNPNIMPNHWNHFLLFREYFKRNIK